MHAGHRQVGGAARSEALGLRRTVICFGESRYQRLPDFVFTIEVGVSSTHYHADSMNLGSVSMGKKGLVMELTMTAGRAPPVLCLSKPLSCNATKKAA
jgi:hypothetical protein